MSSELTHRALNAPGFVPHEEEPSPEDEPAEPVGDELPEPERAAPGETNPPGELLADVLQHGLQRVGWMVEYRWTTFAGHALDAKKGEHRYDVEVALLDADKGDDAGRWLITAKRRTGLFKGLFKGGLDPAEHAALRHDIDAVLAADPRSANSSEAWVTEASWGG